MGTLPLVINLNRFLTQGGDQAFDKFSTNDGTTVDIFWQRSRYIYKDNFSLDAGRLAWYICICHDNAVSLLRAWPKSIEFTFANDDFSVIVCYHKQQSQIVSSKCNCKRSLLFDEYGNHISTACGKQGFRNRINDAVRDCIRDLTSCCSIKTRNEIS